MNKNLVIVEYIKPGDNTEFGLVLNAEWVTRTHLVWLDFADGNPPRSFYEGDVIEAFPCEIEDQATILATAKH